ncbi:MAG: hypothetical protein DMF81_11095 [Acidobacteria bacterium]|nr:MAG: hypothetical protein DMF81_11095 [Acidobacteriota bacterium]
MPVEWPPPASPSSCPPPPLSPWRRHRRPPASRRLVFNEGYAATSGDALVRRELCAEAIRLGRLLRAGSARSAPKSADSPNG